MSKTLLERIVSDASFFYPDKTNFKIIANENTLLKLKSQIEEFTNGTLTDTKSIKPDNNLHTFEFELNNDFVDNFYRAIVVE